MLYYVRINEIDQIIRCRVDANDTFSDLSIKMHHLLLTESTFRFTLYGSTQHKISKISESAPEGTTFTLIPNFDKINFKYELIFNHPISADQYIIYSTISIKTLTEGDHFFLDENKKCKEIKVIIRDFLAERYKIDRTKQIHLFFPGGYPFTHGTIKDYKKTQYKLKYKNHFYVIITKKIHEKLLESDIPNVCDISTPEMKLLLSPCYSDSSLCGLCTIASLLGYIHRNSEDVEYLASAISRFFPFAPLICAVYQFQNRCSISGRTIIQFTAPLFTYLREAIFDQGIRTKNVLEYAPKYLTYLINFNINTPVPCTSFIEPFLNVGIESYFKSVISIHAKHKGSNLGEFKHVFTLFDPDIRDFDWIFIKFPIPTQASLEEASQNVHSLDIISPLDLKKIRRSALFTGVNGPWLFLTGTVEKQHQEMKIDIINPEKGEQETINPDDFAQQILLSIKRSTPLELIDPKKVSQITYILIDKSSSMFESYNNSTRFDIVKQHIFSFLDAAYASLTFSLFGLIVFDRNCEIACPLTVLTPLFKETLEKVQPGTSTAIFKAIDLASKKLVEAHHKYKSAINRIIVLTDGIDNDCDFIFNGKRYFNLDLGALCEYLIENEIRIDSIYISEEIDARLYKITKMTGGCAFYSFDNNFNIFSQEQFHNVLIRQFDPFSNERPTHEEIQAATTPSLKDWDIEIPSKIASIATSNDVLVSPSFISRLYEGKADPPRRTGRILRELRKFNENNGNIRVFPFKEKIDLWRVLIKGPETSKYENCWFYLTIEFPVLYPSSPPNIRFVKPPFHANISDNGFICLTNLDLNYRSDDTVQDLLAAILGLLMFPNTQDPIDSTRSEIVKQDNKEEYERIIQKYNTKNSKSTPEEWMEHWRIEDDDEIPDEFKKHDDIPQEFKCNLTGKLMIEPVKASCGIYFEKSALIEYIKSSQSPVCPVTGKQFQQSDLDLSIDLDLKIRIDQWYDINGL